MKKCSSCGFEGEMESCPTCNTPLVEKQEPAPEPAPETTPEETPEAAPDSGSDAPAESNPEEEQQQ